MMKIVSFLLALANVCSAFYVQAPKAGAVKPLQSTDPSYSYFTYRGNENNMTRPEMAGPGLAGRGGNVVRLGSRDGYIPIIALQ